MTIQTVKVGDIAEQVRGVTYSKSDASADESEGMVPILRANNITDQGLQFSNLVWVPKSCVSSKQMLRKGDIVVATSSGSLDVVGKAAPVEHDVEASFGAFCKVVRPGKTADSHYLANYFKTAKYRSIISSLAAGANINNLRNEHINSLEIPLPPLAEQKRIASILDKADAIRRKLQESLRLSDDFLRSVFLEMFGNPDVRGWDTTTVGDIASEKKGSTRTGPFGSQLLHSEFVDEGIAVLGIDNAVRNKFAWGQPRFITEEKYEDLKRYTVYPGDVLITIMGTCGRCAIVPHDIPKAINTKHLCCITLDQKKCLPEFLHSYFLLHPMARSYLGKAAKGAIMDGLNGGIIKSLPVPLVPIALQRKYAQLVKNRTKVVDHLTSQAAESEALFSSLQQRAFRGEL